MLVAVPQATWVALDQTLNTASAAAEVLAPAPAAPPPLPAVSALPDAPPLLLLTGSLQVTLTPPAPAAAAAATGAADLVHEGSTAAATPSCPTPLPSVKQPSSSQPRPPPPPSPSPAHPSSPTTVTVSVQLLLPGDSQAAPFVMQHAMEFLTPTPPPGNGRIAAPLPSSLPPPPAHGPTPEAGVRALAVLSPGFLVQPEAYRPYLQALAGAGLPAAAYSVPETGFQALDDVAHTQVLERVVAWCSSQLFTAPSPLPATPQLPPSFHSAATQLASDHAAAAQPGSRCGWQPQAVLLMGHSRGAKISALLAARRLAAAAAAAAAGPGDAAITQAAAAAAAGLGDPADTSPTVTPAATADAADAGAAAAAGSPGLSLHDGSGGGSGGSGSKEQQWGVRAAQADLAWHVAGLVLLDPADASYETREGPRFPSAAKTLAALGCGATSLSDPCPCPAPSLPSWQQLPPMLVVGAARNTDCVPRGAAYQSFWNSYRGPRALVVLQQAGHFSFLSSLTLLQQSVCSRGRADPVAVVRAVAAMLLVWADVCQAALPAAVGGPQGMQGQHSKLVSAGVSEDARGSGGRDTSGAAGGGGGGGDVDGSCDSTCMSCQGRGQQFSPGHSRDANGADGGGSDSALAEVNRQLGDVGSRLVGACTLHGLECTVSSGNVGK
ncbi:hypothetical protein V8C86DRAFT_578367 [Haematococcus lacustris]